MPCKNIEPCPKCGWFPEEERPLPYMCCTCSKWDPYESNIERGQCGVIGTGETHFDHSCGDWACCKSGNEKATTRLKNYL